MVFQQLVSRVRRTAIRTVVGGVVVVGTLEVTTHLPSQGRSSQLYHTVADEILVPTMRRVLNPEFAHKVALQLAVLAPTHRPSAKEQRLDVAIRLWKPDNDGDGSGDGNGLVFANPIGLAAGYDKDATAIGPLLNMGFGFVEIGSVCLHPQPGNPSPRMFRLVNDNAIINRYGFNSKGADAVETNLKNYRRSLVDDDEAPTTKDEKPTWRQVYYFLWPDNNLALRNGVVGVNLGKNKTSETPLEDYQSLIRQLGPYADYLVINVSSPNTPGLRDLQEASSLEELLSGCQEACQNMASPKPLLVKLSPDLYNEELEGIASLLLKLKIDGIILTNTTTARPSSLITPGKVKQEMGGLSGQPLKERSTEVIRLLYASTGGTIPIIGVGGVQNGHDAYEKFKAGASLVQVYSGMIYQGPGMVSRIRNEVAELMLQNGQRSLQQEVVGMDHEEIFWKRQRAALKLRDAEVSTLIVDRPDDDDEKKINGSIQEPSNLTSV